MGKFIVLILLNFVTGAWSRQFYVDTRHAQASDANAGTSLSTPWKTISKAAATLVAGDTVSVKAGTYSGNVAPANSGTAQNRITYQRFGNDSVVINGDFNLTKDYITVSGFEISGGSIMFGFQAAGGSYCRILGNYIHHNGSCGMFIHGSYNLIRGNRICSNGSSWGDQITTGWGTGSHHIVFEYNDVSDPEGLGEDFMQYLGHDFIARGNYFHDNIDNGKHNDFYQSGGGEYNIWIIGNLIENFHGQLFMIGTGGDHDHIWRNNLIWGNFGWCFSGTAANAKVYNNTFSLMGGWGAAGCGKARNNIYSPPGSDGQGGDLDYGCVYPVPCCATRGTHDLWGVNPKFADSAKHDCRLKSTSPCINAGTFMTTTTAAGSGTQVPVADAMLFVDGFGIADGDSIQLQGQTQTAKILSINYAARVLTVDRSLTWVNGQGVNTPYSGSAPDIGAYEYGVSASSNPVTAARPAVQYDPAVFSDIYSVNGVRIGVSSGIKIREGAVWRSLKPGIYFAVADHGRERFVKKITVMR